MGQDAVRPSRHVDEQIEFLGGEAHLVAVGVDAPRVEVDPEIAELERRGLVGGRAGAAEGPNAIRKWFYRLVAAGDIKIADLGNMEMSDDLHADHDRATQAIAIALGKAERVAVLGGGHDWGYCPIAALMQGGSVGFVNFDAHLDVRASKVHHSGTSHWRA